MLPEAGLVDTAPAGGSALDQALADALPRYSGCRRIPTMLVHPESIVQYANATNRRAVQSSCIVFVMMTCFSQRTALAQEVPSLAESFFIAPGQGTGEQARAIDTCGRSFRQPLLQSGAFVERQTPEIAAVVSECVGSTSSTSFARECDLATAQSQVDLIILFRATEVPGGWLFEGTAMSPLQAAAVWADDALIEQEHAVLAGREACSQLGDSFLNTRGIGAGPDSPPETAAASSSPAVTVPRGRLEIVHVSPSPVTVSVDGNEVGTAPGQFFDLPLGEVEVLLHAPGHAPLSRRVTLTGDRLEVLRDLSLQALPGTLAVACNVEGAAIFVGAREVGSTTAGGTVQLEVEAGTHVVRVVRDGYTPMETAIDMSPGGRSGITAELNPVAPPERRPQSTVENRDDTEGEDVSRPRTGADTGGRRVGFPPRSLVDDDPVPTSTDSDGDGVADDSDACPHHAEDFDGFQDQDGCPEIADARCRPVEWDEDIYFTASSDVIASRSVGSLDTLAEELTARSELTLLQIEGHTDSRGSDSENLDLSQRRAESVRHSLVDRGVAANRLVAVGFGETRPIADNDTHEGRAQNRRIALEIIEQDGCD